MSSLLYTCPKTHQRAPSGIDTDVQSLRAAWSKTLKVNCPCCGQEHRISVRETFIESTLNDAGKTLSRTG